MLQRKMYRCRRYVGGGGEFSSNLWEIQVGWAEIVLALRVWINVGGLAPTESAAPISKSHDLLSDSGHVDFCGEALKD